MKQFLFAFLILFSFSTGISQTQDHLFILDASGSMWQKLNRSYKINTAREVLKDIYKALPKNSNAGLIVYGHNSAHDCEDIENLIPIMSLDTNQFFTALDELNPSGLTPIAATLEMALEIISSKSTPTTVILISDGLETCGGNACDVIKNAKKIGYNIVSHVIGFGMKEIDLSPLECISQAGGGQYFSANSAAELKASLNQSVKINAHENGQLSIHVTEENDAISASIKIYKKGEYKVFTEGRRYPDHQSNPKTFNLPPGDYEAEIILLPQSRNASQKLYDLNIRPHDTLKHAIDFSTGEIEISITENRKLSDATINIFDSKTGNLISKSRTYKRKDANPNHIRLSPNTFDIIATAIDIEGNPSHTFKNITLRSGERLRFNHNFKSGQIKVGAFNKGACIDATIKIKHPISGIEIARGRTYQTKETNPTLFKVNPNNYRIEITPLNNKTLDPKSILIKVSEGGIVELLEEW